MLVRLEGGEGRLSGSQLVARSLELRLESLNLVELRGVHLELLPLLRVRRAQVADLVLQRVGQHAKRTLHGAHLSIHMLGHASGLALHCELRADSTQAILGVGAQLLQRRPQPVVLGAVCCRHRRWPALGQVHMQRGLREDRPNLRRAHAVDSGARRHVRLRTGIVARHSRHRVDTGAQSPLRGGLGHGFDGQMSGRVFGTREEERRCQRVKGEAFHAKTSLVRFVTLASKSAATEGGTVVAGSDALGCGARAVSCRRH